MGGSVAVAVVGAGPYGLSVAAQLRARGVECRVFGQPMKTWLPMPRSLCLKSLGFATSLAVPQQGLDFPRWLRERGLEDLEPISYAEFTAYGLDVQRALLPDVDAVEVARLGADGGGFRLELQNGETVLARRVVVATGLAHLQKMPALFAGQPRELVSHSFGQYGFGHLLGKEVAVIGAGQSALEVAVLLHEAGARPTLIAHQPPIFHGRTARERSVYQRLKEPLTVLGGGRLNWVLEHFPWLVQYAPEGRRVRFARGYLGPSGAWWLRDRFVDRVPVLAPAELASIRESGGEVELELLLDGRKIHRRFAHVVCGSGFEHDLGRLPFLDPALLASLERIQGKAPRLDRGFQSSTAGLYFVGPLSAYAFGPLFRFVCGATYAAPTAARAVATGLERRSAQRRQPSPTAAPAPGARAA